LDEVGRGPLAGPVVAAAVVIQNTKYKIQDTKIRDSKKLTSKQREKFYKIFKKTDGLKWGIGKVSEKVIDRINILEATKLAMERAVRNLNCKLKNKNCRVDYLILDGKMELDLLLPQKSIIKGDEKVFSVALASIIAKVTRDRLMCRFAKKYPRYGFDKHKGYGTKDHLKMLKKFGHCQIHRKSFKPLKKNN